MSTNYYTHVNACPTCKRARTVLHVGKRTGTGFILNVGGYDHPASLAEWMSVFTSHDIVIRDEYDEVIHVSDMVGIINGGDMRTLSGWFR